MSQIITATVENGTLKPDRDLGLASGTKVRVTVEQCDNAIAQANVGCDELDRLCDEIPIDSHENRLTRDQLHERH